MNLKSVIKQGYFLKYLRKKEESNDTHIFCGAHSVQSAWCPNCQKPLLRFLALNTRDSRLGLEKSPFQWLSLFFCWTCQIAVNPFYYQITSKEEIELLKYGEGSLKSNFPWTDYPVYFPKAYVHLQPLTDHEQQTIKGLNRDEISGWEINRKTPYLNRPAHQVGGEPYLVQMNPDYQTDAWTKEIVTCLKCGKLMPFLAAIGDKTRSKMGFAGNDFVQVIFNYCKRDRLICAFQQCD